jgi:hypothetical protein
MPVWGRGPIASLRAISPTIQSKPVAGPRRPSGDALSARVRDRLRSSTPRPCGPSIGSNPIAFVGPEACVAVCVHSNGNGTPALRAGRNPLANADRETSLPATAAPCRSPQLRVYTAECGVKGGAQRSHGRDDCYGNASGKQAVFDCACTRAVTQKTHDRRHGIPLAALPKIRKSTCAHLGVD